MEEEGTYERKEEMMGRKRGRKEGKKKRSKEERRRKEVMRGTKGLVG